MQDLLAALQMFKQGVQEAATASAINDAHAQVQQIRTGIQDEAQQRQAFQNLSNDVALRLTGVGANGQQIQSAFQAIAPQNFGSAEQLQLEGMLSGNKQYQQQAESIIGQRDKKQKDLLAIQHQYDLEKLAMQAAMGARQSAGKPLNSEEIEKITVAQNVYLDGQQLLDMAKKDSTLIGPVDALKPNFMSSDNGVFNQLYGNYRDSFIQKMTGAGMSNEEAKRLAEDIPSMTGSQATFVKQMEAFNARVDRELSGRIGNLEAAGRNTEGVKAAWDSKMMAQRQKAAKLERLKKFQVK